MLKRSHYYSKIILLHQHSLKASLTKMHRVLICMWIGSYSIYIYIFNCAFLSLYPSTRLKDLQVQRILEHANL